MVAWSKLNIHAGFIEKFLSIHKVKNLRTLEKAQRFFEDVRLYCKDDEPFLDEVRLICFAVVVESTDKLYMSSDKTKKIYQEEIESMKKFLIETYVEYLQNTTHGKKAYEYSRKLRNYYGDSSYHDVIVSESKKLYNENSFPISEVDEEQYFTCRNIMDILYRSDGEKFLQYCDALKEKCDNMSKHRIETLLGQLVKK